MEGILRISWGPLSGVLLAFCISAEAKETISEMLEKAGSGGRHAVSRQG